MIGGRLCDYGALSSPSSGTQRFQLPAFGPNPGPDFSLSGFCGASGQVGYLRGSVGTEGEPPGQASAGSATGRHPIPSIKSYSSALSASRTVPNRTGPIIPAIDVTMMIIRRFVSILTEAGYILRLFARVEAHPRTTLQAAL